MARRTGTRGTGQRAGLSRRQVLDAAHALAAERGLEALTMRALAERLDVVPNAVYRWIPTKAALLDALVDETLASVSEPPGADLPGVDPEVAVRGRLLSLFDAVTSRPALAALSMNRRAVPGPMADTNRERLRELLLACGLDDDRAATLTRVLLVHTIGFAAFVAQTEGGALLQGGEDLGGPRATFLQGLDWTLRGALGHVAASNPQRQPVERARPLPGESVSRSRHDPSAEASDASTSPAGGRGGVT